MHRETLSDLQLSADLAHKYYLRQLKTGSPVAYRDAKRQWVMAKIAISNAMEREEPCSHNTNG